jgi:hypothetical protein
MDILLHRTGVWRFLLRVCSLAHGAWIQVTAIYTYEYTGLKDDFVRSNPTSPSPFQHEPEFARCNGETVLPVRPFDLVRFFL